MKAKLDEHGVLFLERKGKMDFFAVCVNNQEASCNDGCVAFREPRQVMQSSRYVIEGCCWKYEVELIDEREGE